jgi:hypothetical protein
MTEPTQRERLATLETQMAHLTATVDGMDAKLTSLVTLKDKGAGAIWLAGLLWASGIIGGIGALWQWLRG